MLQVVQRPFVSFGANLFKRMPPSVNDFFVDVGVCHYMTIFKTPGGQLYQFDFGPKGGGDISLGPAESTRMARLFRKRQSKAVPAEIREAQVLGPHRCDSLQYIPEFTSLSLSQHTACVSPFVVADQSNLVSEPFWSAQCVHRFLNIVTWSMSTHVVMHSIQGLAMTTHLLISKNADQWDLSESKTCSVLYDASRRCIQFAPQIRRSWSGESDAITSYHRELNVGCAFPYFISDRKIRSYQIGKRISHTMLILGNSVQHKKSMWSVHDFQILARWHVCMSPESHLTDLFASILDEEEVVKSISSSFEPASKYTSEHDVRHCLCMLSCPSKTLEQCNVFSLCCSCNNYLRPRYRLARQTWLFSKSELSTRPRD